MQQPAAVVNGVDLHDVELRCDVGVDDVAGGGSGGFVAEWRKNNMVGGGLGDGEGGEGYRFGWKLLLILLRIIGFQKRSGIWVEILPSKKLANFRCLCLSSKTSIVNKLRINIDLNPTENLWETRSNLNNCLH